MDEPYFVPSPEVARAVAYAAEQHGDQTRKGTRIPYLQHLLGTASIAMEHGATEIEAVAAILHDVIEDTMVDEDELREAFGTEVTTIVVSCSAEAKTEEDAAESWRTRKEAYLTHLGESSPAAVLVSLADKIHNARSIAAVYRREGDAIWERFNADRDEQRWYYEKLLTQYEDRVSQADARITAAMVAELKREIEAFTGPA